jgi:hypothetical protein
MILWNECLHVRGSVGSSEEQQLASQPTPQSPDRETHLVQVVRFFVHPILAQKAAAEQTAHLSGEPDREERTQ